MHTIRIRVDGSREEAAALLQQLETEGLAGKIARAGGGEFAAHYYSEPITSAVRPARRKSRKVSRQSAPSK